MEGNRLKICFIVLFFLMNCMSEKYIEFKPVIQEGDKLIYVEEDYFSSAFTEHFKDVLQFYKEDYKISKEGVLLIPETLYQDKELLWNYTTKANDPLWLKQHIEE